MDVPSEVLDSWYGTGRTRSYKTRYDGYPVQVKLGTTTTLTKFAKVEGACKTAFLQTGVNTWSKVEDRVPITRVTRIAPWTESDGEIRYAHNVVILIHRPSVPTVSRSEYGVAASDAAGKYPGLSTPVDHPPYAQDDQRTSSGVVQGNPQGTGPGASPGTGPGTKFGRNPGAGPGPEMIQYLRQGGHAFLHSIRNDPLHHKPQHAPWGAAPVA